MTDEPRDARAVWERVQTAQLERWREHVEPHLPERLLDQLTDGPAEQPGH